MSNRKVTYARLQTAMHVPGVCQLDPVFPQSNKTLDNLDMSTDGASLFIKFTYKSDKVEMLIPFGNVVGMRLAAESATP